MDARGPGRAAPDRGRVVTMWPRAAATRVAGAASLPALLAVDEDVAVLRLIRRVATDAGFDVVPCAGGRQAIARLDQQRFDVVLVDLRMPEVGGLDVVRAVQAHDRATATVLMTGHGSIESAVEAIKLGAVDYLTKPFDLSQLQTLLGDFRARARQRSPERDGDDCGPDGSDFHGLIGQSDGMVELFASIRQLGPHVRTARVTGETGTGKELVARALHAVGPRRPRRFLTVNCSAFVESLTENELFGHTRGAFTGATGSKAGLFETANGATVFLDEVGELPPSMQAKLLRVLENGEVQPVGAVEPRLVDVSIIAATNRDLARAVDRGLFRRDLYYRLNVVSFALPPLRERADDIPRLAEAFVTGCAERLGRPIRGLSPAAVGLLAGLDWPGNVRELRNTIERACLLSGGGVLTEHDVTRSVPGGGPVVPPADPRTVVRPLIETPADAPLAAVEREHIRRTLDRAGGNKAAAARILGLSRRAFYRRLERHGLHGR